MRRLIALFLSVATVVLLISVACGASLSGQDKPPVLSITLTGPTESRTGTPIRLKASLTNLSSQLVLIPGTRTPSGPHYDFDVEVRDAKDERMLKKPPKQARPEELPVNTSFAIPLPPGKVISLDLDILDAYDLRKPGAYTVQIQRSDVDGKSVAISNRITLRVMQ